MIRVLTIGVSRFRHADQDTRRDRGLSAEFGQTGGDRRFAFGLLRVGFADRVVERDIGCSDELDRSGRGVSINGFWFL